MIEHCSSTIKLAKICNTEYKIKKCNNTTPFNCWYLEGRSNTAKAYEFYRRPKVHCMKLIWSPCILSKQSFILSLREDRITFHDTTKKLYELCNNELLSLLETLNQYLFFWLYHQQAHVRDWKGIVRQMKTSRSALKPMKEARGIRQSKEKIAFARTVYDQQ